MKNNNIYYVYLHIRETDGQPFYVGKGKGSRINKKFNRSDLWNNIVNKYGYDSIMLEKDLTEKEAFEIEKYWINRIGRRDLGKGPLVNFTDGGEGTSGMEPINKGVNCPTIWTYKNCKEEAKKYDGRTQFCKNNPSAYNSSKKYGWLDEFYPIDKRTLNNKGITNGFYGKKHSKESKIKMSISSKK